MAATTSSLFEMGRVKRRVLMHVSDAGNAPSGAMIVHFRCPRCRHDAGWHVVASVTEGKRGLPCPHCNSADASRSEGEQTGRQRAAFDTKAQVKES